MRTKKEAIKVIKDIITRNKRIKLDVSTTSLAMWNGENITSLEWKHIGYISALCWTFNITKKDLEEQ